MAWAEISTKFTRDDGVSAERFIDDDGYSNFIIKNASDEFVQSLQPGDSWPNYPACSGDLFEAALFAYIEDIIPSV